MASRAKEWHSLELEEGPGASLNNGAGPSGGGAASAAAYPGNSSKFPIWVDLDESGPGRARAAGACKYIFQVLALILLGVISGHTKASSKHTAPAPEAHAYFGLPDAVAITTGLKHIPGLLPLHISEEAGKVIIEVPAKYWRDGHELIYLSALEHGLGTQSLFRGAMFGKHPTRVVRFRRWGHALRLVAQNTAHTSGSGDPFEARAVNESFAEAALWHFPAVAARADGAVLVDASHFLLRDSYGVTDIARRSGGGDWRLDSDLSAPAASRCKAFPLNTALSVELTFTYAAASADPYHFTVAVRHTFAAPPAPGYLPRKFDPRAGVYGTTVRDYSAPLGADTATRFVHRHRLSKDMPLQYHLDRAAPEPLRSALLEGARWWAAAFEAAGAGAGMFKVDLLPEDADPLDMRYNMIEWVHRLDRGYSVGHEVIDPRTGEIIKGHVTLGSLRARQDYLIAEGLLLPYASGAAPTLPGGGALNMTLARIRQLVAHEVGHTLGLAHNFAASSTGRRASVMDYPPPRVEVSVDGGITVPEDVYAEGVGEWDLVAIKYLYTEFSPSMAEPASPEVEAAGLEAILQGAEDAGLWYLTDSDVAGGATPASCKWDRSRYGADPSPGMETALTVRRAALDAFGPAALAPGRALADLEAAFVPIYLYHRYEVECVVHAVGGVDYSPALRPMGVDAANVPPAAEPLPATVQRSALAAVLRSVHPAELEVPARIVALLGPRPSGFTGRDGAPGELFAGYTGAEWDAIAPAEIAAGLVFKPLLELPRAARLAQQSAYAPAGTAPLNLTEVTGAVLAAAFAPSPPPEGPAQEAVMRAVQRAAVDAALGLMAGAAGSTADVAAAAPAMYDQLLEYIGYDGSHQTFLQAKAASSHPELTGSHLLALAQRVAKFWEAPLHERAAYAARPGADLPVPRGSPI